MTRRRAFLERTHRVRERARRQRRAGPDPAAMVRLAALGAAGLITLAVFVGFTETGRDAGWLSVFARLESVTRPVLLGASILEMTVVGAVVAIVVVFLLRARVAAKREAETEDDEE